MRIDDGIIQYTDDLSLNGSREVKARDRQAAGYLEHSKLPTQIAAVKRLLRRLPPSVSDRPVYELGAGPGPMTPLLLDRGYDVVSFDFSHQSLVCNRETVAPGSRDRATYVRADINRLQLAPASTNLLLMCDFLQHLGGHASRADFLARAGDWLAPGGFLYLTFVNLNIKNYLKGDMHGSFSDGAIRYERLLPSEVMRLLPADVIVESMAPLHVMTAPGPDRLMSKIPGARYLARMIAIRGRKRA